MAILVLLIIASCSPNDRALETRPPPQEETRVSPTGRAADPVPTPPEPPALPPRSADTPSKRVAVSSEHDYTAPDGLEALGEEEMEIARRLMEDYPEDGRAIGLSGDVYSRRGDSVRAVKCWQRCLQLDPNHAGAYVNLGAIALDHGEYDEATALWRKALQLDPNLPGLRNRLARALLCQGKTQQMIATLEEDVKVSPSPSQSHFLLGQAHLLLKDYEKARGCYEAAIDVEPDCTNAYYGLATVCAKLADVEKSRQCRERFKILKAKDLQVRIDRAHTFDDLVSVRRDVARTCTDAGKICLRHGDRRKAETLWRKATVLDPKDTVCRLQLALLCQLEDRDGEALRICQQVSAMDPRNPMHYLNIGLLNGRLKRFEAAQRAFRKVNELAPRRSEGYRELAQLYLRTNRKLAEARTLAETAVRLAPIAPNYFVLSWACDRSGDLDGAVGALQRAMQLDPNNAKYRRMYEQITARK